MPRLRALLALALLLASTAAAAQPSADDSARALSLGREALELYGKSDFHAAFERFSAADRAAHSPVFVLYMARSRRGEGDLLASRELFTSIVGEAIPPGSPEPWQRAHDDAAKELAALDTRIPTLIVTLRGAPSEGASLSIDGAPVAPAALRAPIRLNPGAHTIVARAAGRKEVSETIRLAEGDEPRRLDMLLPAPPAVSAAPSASAPPPVVPPPPGPRRGSLLPGFLCLGAGVAGLSAGAITGVVAKGRAADVKANCVDGHCLASDKDKADSATTLATVSTVTFVVGGAAAAAGVVLVLLRPGGGSGVDARLTPGPGSLSLQGSF